MKIKLFSLLVLIFCILSLCSFVPREEIVELRSYDSNYDSLSPYLSTPPLYSGSGLPYYSVDGCEFKHANTGVLAYSDFFTDSSYLGVSTFPASLVLNVFGELGNKMLNVVSIKVDSNYDIYIQTDLSSTYYKWYDDSSRGFSNITINNIVYDFKTSTYGWNILEDNGTFYVYDNFISKLGIWLYNLSVDTVSTSLTYDLSFYDFGFFFENVSDIQFDFISNSLPFDMVNFTSDTIKYYDSNTLINGEPSRVTAYSEGIWNNFYNRITISSGQYLPRFFLNFLSVGSSAEILFLGWYRFNDFVSLPGGNGAMVYKTANPDYFITFESNGKEYLGISFVPLGSTVTYGDLVYSNGQWSDNSFRYFNVLEDSSVDSEFYSFVTSNSIYYSSNLPDYVNGYNDGYSSGYDNGYSVGVSVGESNTIIRDFFVDLFTSVPRALDSLVVYSYDGVVVTVWGIIGMVFMIFALGWILKLIAGG